MSEEDPSIYEELKKEIKKLKIYLPYIPVVLSSIFGLGSGILIGYGYVLFGSLVLISDMGFAVYILKKFDARPDVARAKEEIKDMEKVYKENLDKLTKLNEEYNNLDKRIKEADSKIAQIMGQMINLAQALDNAAAKMDFLDKKATGALLGSLISLWKGIVDSRKRR